MVWLDLDAVNGLLDGYCTAPSQDFDHIAVVRPIEVLNKDECRTRGCRQTRKQRAKRFQSSGRGSDAYNWYGHSKTRPVAAAVAVYFNTLKSKVLAEPHQSAALDI